MHRVAPPPVHLHGGNYNNLPNDDFTVPPRAVDHFGNKGNLTFVQPEKLSHQKRGKAAEKGFCTPLDKCLTAYQGRRKALE